MASEQTSSDTGRITKTEYGRQKLVAWACARAQASVGLKILPSLRVARFRLSVLVICGSLALVVSACGTRPQSQPLKAVLVAPMLLVQPDVQVLILRDGFGHEMVDLTYPMVVPRDQAKRDVDAIAQAASLPSSNLDITDAALPLAGVKSTEMTSATFETMGAIPEGSTSFRIEPWIIALRSYPNVAITYMMPPAFIFNGLRTYQDGNVQIALDHEGQSYTYHVRVLDNNFDHLNLPLMQPDPQAIEYAQAREQHSSTMRVVGLILLSVTAAGAGYAVYVLLSRLH
jgi:hypothetical protein